MSRYGGAFKRDLESLDWVSRRSQSVMKPDLAHLERGSGFCMSLFLRENNSPEKWSLFLLPPFSMLQHPVWCSSGLASCSSWCDRGLAGWVKEEKRAYSVVGSAVTPPAGQIQLLSHISLLQHCLAPPPFNPSVLSLSSTSRSTLLPRHYPTPEEQFLSPIARCQAKESSATHI